jgi:trimethylguanosine synthase
MTVIANRSDLWDSAAHFQPEENQHPNPQHHHLDAMVAPYHFAPMPGGSSMPDIHHHSSIAVMRVPHTFQQSSFPVPPADTNANTERDGEQNPCNVIDTTIPNPHRDVHDKYWTQRRRLFSRFDRGIELDSEGWYSVTPEIIADHVAHRVAELATARVIPRLEDDRGIVILDAFCGCGGNSIAFGKIPSDIISKVVCCDTDRTKLIKAAHNASLYDIPKDKLIFVECNAAFILKHCFKDGEFILDKPTSTMPPYMPPPVRSSKASGYRIGGLDLLPRRIDAVFMDPPWGGVDYEVLGKNGYDLQKNMKIQVGPCEEEYEADGDGVGDDFFDTFSTPSKHQSMSQKSRKANFNKKTDGQFIDGMELLKVAAEATSSHIVLYDLPRNTSKMSLGRCALGAGYRGNIKLEEHYLNGRLKTVTAYMGGDFCDLINIFHEKSAVSDES